MEVKQEVSESTTSVVNNNNTSLLSRMFSRLVSTLISYFTNPSDHHPDNHHSGSGSTVESSSPQASITIESDDVEASGGNHFENSPTNPSIIASQTHSPSSSPSTNQTSSTLSCLFQRTNSDSGSPQPSCQCQCQSSHLLNLSAQAFRELEIGKAFLTFILPVTTLLLAVHSKDTSPLLLHLTLCLLCTALVTLFYGISLRNMFPEIGNVFEQLGIACIYASFFLVVGFHLPPALVFFPLISCVLCFLPSFYSCIPVKKEASPSTKLMKS